VTRFAWIAVFCLALTGCGGEGRSDAPKRQREPNPRSIGAIDIPANGATVDSPVRVSGWAVDESGVTGVRVFFDDELVATAPIGTPRPDIEQRFTQYSAPGAIHGFDSLIDARAHAGFTVVRAVAIDGKGAQTEISSITIRIRE
jgi:hypothetical protein